MSFKTKALGLLAGSALMLSVASGATADDATGTASVTLSENPSAVGCTGTISIDSFNNATWNPTEERYEFDQSLQGEPTRAQAALYVIPEYKEKFPGDTSNCDAQIRRSDFKDDSTGATIPSNAIELRVTVGTSGSVGINVGTDTPLFSDREPSISSLHYLLVNVSGVTAAPGSYSSTLTVTITEHEE